MGKTPPINQRVLWGPPSRPLTVHALPSTLPSVPGAGELGVWDLCVIGMDACAGAGVGTLMWMAPELLGMQAGAAPQSAPAVDVFAFAVVL